MSPHTSPCPSLPLFVRIPDNQGTVEAGILFYLTRLGWDADERPVTASMESGGGSGPGRQTDALIGIMICLNYLPTCLPSQNSVGRSPVPWLGRSWEHLPARFSFKGDFFLKHWPSCSQEHNTQSWVQVIFSERSLQVWEHKLPALSFL